MGDEQLIGIWRGPFIGHTVTGGTLHPGEQYPVTEEDLQSGHWERVSPPQLQAPAPTPTFAAAAPGPAEPPSEGII